MDREVPMEEGVRCDSCGFVGPCFDFMGDFLCTQCADRLIKDEDESGDSEEGD